MNFLVSYADNFKTCIREAIKSLWTFHYYSHRENKYSPGGHINVFCQQFIYKVIVNQPYCQLYLYNGFVDFLQWTFVFNRNLDFVYLLFLLELN